MTQIINLIFLIFQVISLILFLYARNNMTNNNLLLIALCFGVPGGIYLFITDCLKSKELKFDLSKRKQYIESILSAINTLIVGICATVLVLLLYLGINSRFLYIALISVGLFSLLIMPIIMRIINKKK